VEEGLLVGTATSPTGTTGSAIMLGDNAGDPTPGADTAGIYGKDVSGSTEVFVVDEAGNSTQISPHDPDSGEWVFSSHNTRTGAKFRVRMDELCRRLVDLFPDQLSDLVELDD
jgi:hypothetical protein